MNDESMLLTVDGKSRIRKNQEKNITSRAGANNNAKVVIQNCGTLVPWAIRPPAMMVASAPVRKARP